MTLIKKKAARPAKRRSSATPEAIVAELFRLGAEKFNSERQFAFASHIDPGTMRYVREKPASCTLDKLCGMAQALGFTDIYDMFDEVGDALSEAV